MAKRWPDEQKADIRPSDLVRYRISPKRETRTNVTSYIRKGKASAETDDFQRGCYCERSEDADR